MKNTYSKYEIEDANNVPILDVVNRLNIEIHGKKPILCPFHDEKTPSLNFNLRKNSWKCFGCGEGGGVIDFVIKYQGVSFPEAVAWLRNETNIKITPQKHKSSKAKPPKSIKVPNPDIYEHFHSLCIDSEIINDFYHVQKKIDKEVLNNARIRVLDNPKQVSSELLNRWGEKKLLECGIFSEHTNRHTGEIFSSLHWYEPNTVIIPFFNELSRITYLKGRILNIERGHRNLKDCKTDIYNRIILRVIKNGDDLYLCEGETDTLSALSMGLNAIGLLGASSFDQKYVDFLKNYNIFIVPDNDSAGVHFFQTIKDAFNEIDKPVNRISIDPKFKDLNEQYGQ